MQPSFAVTFSDVIALGLLTVLVMACFVAMFGDWLDSCLLRWRRGRRWWK